MKRVTSLFLFLIFSLLCVGCTDDVNQTTEDGVVISTSGHRVVAKNYKVLASSHENRQCRHEPTRDAEVLFSLEKGQIISLLSITEKGRRVKGALWLHVSVEREEESCFVLADVLVPVASPPIIK